MKDLHLIFNIDYKNKNGQLNFFRESIVKHIRNIMIEIPTFDQFKTLISTLDECNCYIWVHPSLGSEIVSEGYESEIIFKVVPELDSMDLEYMMITRTSNISTSKSIIHVNEMTSFMKRMKSYSVSELKNKLKSKINKESLIDKMHLQDPLVDKDDNIRKVLIVTATRTETDVFFETFRKKRKIAKPYSSDKITYWDFGVLGNCRILMVKQGDMGSIKPNGSFLVIKDAIDLLNPDYVIMVGIAFGLKRDKQVIGQVLISSELENYEFAKITETKTIQRGNKIPAGVVLINRFDNSSIIYKKVKSEIGFIISGDKLVDSKEFVTKLIDIYPDAIGGEMEGTGLQSTCYREKKEWILIKGICDWGYDKQNPDKEKHQEIAINNVCNYLIYTLKKFKL